MGSEAMEDCVQGALSSLYPPFESTAPPLLSQVFSVLESTYQHDSLRYLLDYFVPAKHLLHKLQQHACSQYLGCLFLHSGWPLCLGEKVVVQLSTLDWRLLRCNDFYLQVVPFSTRCPRLALKCLAPGGRTVQEILVPESQHPLVFTSEWLHCINKERGHKREGNAYAS
ncbi:Rho guanine nucleotide exchange factor 40 [Goodea atripinnis]|uniref:Rho guanine nucleotide exchange factor 40 n=1 Tax=Goodea atripinnis TaxID=208336 RepID=A0ABV0PEH1_9TELE